MVNGPDVSLRSGSAQQLRSAAKKRQAKQAYDNKRYERAHVRNGNRRRRTSKNARSHWHEVSSHRHYAANFAATQQEKCAAAKTFCFGRRCPIPSRPSRSSQNFDCGRCAQAAKGEAVGRTAWPRWGEYFRDRRRCNVLALARGLATRSRRPSWQKFVATIRVCLLHYLCTSARGATTWERWCQRRRDDLARSLCVQRDCSRLAAMIRRSASASAATASECARTISDFLPIWYAVAMLIVFRPRHSSVRRNLRLLTRS